jgi:hypothetical protein
MFTFLLSSFEVTLPGNVISVESEKLVDGSRTNYISLCNTGTTVSCIKDNTAVLMRLVFKQQVTI